MTQIDQITILVINANGGWPQHHPLLCGFAFLSKNIFSSDIIIEIQIKTFLERRRATQRTADFLAFSLKAGERLFSTFIASWL
jgi:hypothetical protein